MGILGSILSGAISGGVSKALNKAVENAVKQGVEQNAAGTAAGQPVGTTGQPAGAQTSPQGAGQTEAGLGGVLGGLGALGGLGTVLGGMAANAQSYATEVSKNVKICPNCGEACSADRDFCPQCGAKLPQETAADAYTCPKCGRVNTPGTKFCAKCGATLPGAEQEVARGRASDEAALREFSTKLSHYPMWHVGGRDFQLSDCGMRNGYPCYTWDVTGPSVLLSQYITALKAAGFVDKGHNGETYIKNVGGVYYAFNTTDACCDNNIHVGFYVDEAPLAQQTGQQPQIDMASVAKGLFKKLF